MIYIYIYDMSHPEVINITLEKNIERAWFRTATQELTWIWILL